MGQRLAPTLYVAFMSKEEARRTLMYYHELVNCLNVWCLSMAELEEYDVAFNNLKPVSNDNDFEKIDVDEACPELSEKSAGLTLRVVFDQLDPLDGHAKDGVGKGNATYCCQDR
ncbi:hypothetical protein KIN20_021709, partial [Parelaphostrongylus tenuis]